jgi:hypothetical protein
MTTTKLDSPARGLAALIRGPGKTDRTPKSSELRSLIQDSINYFEQEIAHVESIKGVVPEAELAALVHKTEKLASKSNKTDDEYLALAISERKISDLKARRDAAGAKATSADSVLMAELHEWASRLSSLITEHKSSTLRKTLERLLSPYTEGPHRLRECVDQIPAYQREKFYNRWNPPSVPAIRSGTAPSGTDSARDFVAYLTKQLGELKD